MVDGTVYDACMCVFINMVRCTLIIVHGPESENLPPLGNFRDPPSFLPEGVLYSFPGVVKLKNAANMQKHHFFAQTALKIFTFSAAMTLCRIITPIFLNIPHNCTLLVSTEC